MSYEEFERQILRLVYEEGLERLAPTYLAYALGLSYERVHTWLEQATDSGLLEMDVSTEGHVEYFVPGVERAARATGAAPSFSAHLNEALAPSPALAAAMVTLAEEGAPTPAAGHAEEADGAASRTARPPAAAPPPGPLMAARWASPTTPTTPPAQKALVRTVPAAPASPGLPGPAHFARANDGADGSLSGMPHNSPVLARNARVDPRPIESRALVRLQSQAATPIRVETATPAVREGSQSVFTRQLRVYGVPSEQALQHRIQQMFESLGYRLTSQQNQRLRFERGSVAFILALVPLFVLVIPLFIHLFLYSMGRSTIEHEPVELDIQFRPFHGTDPYWEIDITFVGLHGVVLGRVDQRVLNQEIDALRDELRWSLLPG